MATTTPNYGWPVPTSSDLVKNGATAIEALGDAADATMATMVPKSIVDAKGDIIAATAADTVARLALGTDGQVLTVDTTTATGLKYATPSAGGGGKVLQVVQGTTTTQTTVSTTSYVSTGITASITPSSATSKILVIWSTTWAKADSNTGAGLNFKLKRTSTYLTFMEGVGYDFTTSGNRGSAGQNYLDSPSTTSATTYTVDMANFSGTSTNYVQVSSSTGTITLMEIGA